MHKNKNGSVMIPVLILAVIMALGVGSFIQVANHENRMANIAFYSNNSFNLAEAGVEKGLYAINFADWTGWVASDGDAAMSHSFDLGDNKTGVISVFIESYARNPVIISEGRTILPGRPDTVKQVEVRLGRRGFWANGATARTGVRFAGGSATVDSYRSSDGPPSATNLLDNGSVASVSVDVDAVDISTATIWGWVATGGNMPNVGPNGTITGADTPPGVDVDLNRVALDFASDFPHVSPPDHVHFSIGSINSSVTLGTPGATEPTIYHASQINLVNDTLTIVGPVVIVVDGNVRIGGGSGAIQVVPGVGVDASLTLYVEGDMDVAGTGVVNTSSVPAHTIIYGTNRNTQDFNFSGNAALHAAIYAPEASVSLKGGGSSGKFAGAIVGRDIFINGNYSFHYDEDLGDLVDDDASYNMESWRELNHADERFLFTLR